MRINSIDWDILLVSPNHPMLRRNDGSYTLGSCDNRLRTIFICDGLSSQKTKKVLCHEITHAAMFSYNVVLSVEQEELVADLIATYSQEIIQVTNDIFLRLRE